MNLRFQCFQKTGCLITADGSDDDLIKPEGLIGYRVPLPLPTQPHKDPALLPTPDSTPPEQDEITETEGNEEEVVVENDEHLEIDTESDRDLKRNELK